MGDEKRQQGEEIYRHGNSRRQREREDENVCDENKMKRKGKN